MDSTSDFWTSAVRIYAAPGVAEQCLMLQDEHDQCVPLLLWAAWAAEKGANIDAPLAGQAAGLARQWSQDVVAPLRAVRRRLKSPVSSGDEAVRLPLREKIKSAELTAERALMTLLESIVPSAMPIKPSLKQAITPDIYEALVAVSTAWSDGVPHDALASLTERLTKG